MNIRISILALGTLAAAAACGGSVEVSADSGETLGMIKISKTNAVNSEIVLGIPFMKSPWGGTNTVNTLLVAGYGADSSDGDTIRVWNPSKPSTRGYDMWETWPDGTGSNLWLRIQDIGKERPAEATEYAVSRGTAFWFADVSGNPNDLVQAGLVKPGAQSTVAAGTAEIPVKTLLINPFYTEVNAAALLATGAQTGDQLSLVNGTERFEYRDGKWGHTVRKAVVVGGRTIYKNVFEAVEQITVPAHVAFWYISTGGSPTVSWDK